MQVELGYNSVPVKLQTLGPYFLSGDNLNERLGDTLVPSKYELLANIYISLYF